MSLIITNSVPEYTVSTPAAIHDCAGRHPASRGACEHLYMAQGVRLQLSVNRLAHKLHQLMVVHYFLLIREFFELHVE
ncbi:hypothetical protein [Paenibacillus xerothermodurans]|uniref:hypothetical protein n=1 Tax=Paenibacillus xerothermodurans TaxID=1977292 RepID=UPI001402180B|nr:hypothetical protein [Paenibacillus xerothermodurans]